MGIRGKDVPASGGAVGDDQGGGKGWRQPGRGGGLRCGGANEPTAVFARIEKEFDAIDARAGATRRIVRNARYHVTPERQYVISARIAQLEDGAANIRQRIARCSRWTSELRSGRRRKRDFLRKRWCEIHGSRDCRATG